MLKMRYLGCAATAAAGIALAPLPAAAQTVPTRVTSGALAALCAQNSGACLTYILGVIDGAVLLSGERALFCLPAGLSNEQVADTAVRYVRSRPPQENANGASVVLTGLAATYPCR